MHCRYSLYYHNIKTQGHSVPPPDVVDTLLKSSGDSPSPPGASGGASNHETQFKQWVEFQLQEAHKSPEDRYPETGVMEGNYAENIQAWVDAFGQFSVACDVPSQTLYHSIT